MANKNVKINKKTAYQGLVGWSGGKPAITKANPEVIKDPAKLKPKDLEITVDDGVITSSAVPPQQYYWIVGTQYYVKKDDVT